jgi:spermidine synthase
LTATATANALVRDGTFVRHLEDYLATVDVKGGSPRQRQIYVTGVGMTGLTVDTKLMAYLPKVLRPGSSTLLDIAFGMGSTYKSGLLLGLKTDAVELSPSVPSQMGAFQADADKYLHSPLGRIIEADGRNYVSLTNARYDLIVVDPPPPIQSAGTVVLYTREFIQQARSRLNPGGVFLLWIPYNEWMFDFKAHARTLRSVFAHSMLVFGPGHNGVFMLGSDRPMAFTGDAVRRYLGSDAAAADLAAAPDDPRLDGDGWTRLVRQSTWKVDSEIDSFAGPGPLITDDRPLTEYYLLRTTFSADAVINEELLRHGP